MKKNSYKPADFRQILRFFSQICEIRLFSLWFCLWLLLCVDDMQLWLTKSNSWSEACQSRYCRFSVAHVKMHTNTMCLWMFTTLIILIWAYENQAMTQLALFIPWFRRHETSVMVVVLNIKKNTKPKTEWYTCSSLMALSPRRKAVI